MGLNDPQWGNKNGGGPPDIETVLRDINKKISALFGNKGAGTGNTGGGARGREGNPQAEL